MDNTTEPKQEEVGEIREDPPVKRGRGRPKKVTSVTEEDEDASPSPAPGGDTPSRGPGRPRKYPVDSEDGRPRGPGRPRKSPLDPGEGTSSGTLLSLTRRGPGRPRKSSVLTNSDGSPKRRRGRPKGSLNRKREYGEVPDCVVPGKRRDSSLLQIVVPDSIKKVVIEKNGEMIMLEV